MAPFVPFPSLAPVRRGEGRGEGTLLLFRRGWAAGIDRMK
jgi:hypothetical protein